MSVRRRPRLISQRRSFAPPPPRVIIIPTCKVEDGTVELSHFHTADRGQEKETLEGEVCDVEIARGFSHLLKRRQKFGTGPQVRLLFLSWAYEQYNINKPCRCSWLGKKMAVKRRRERDSRAVSN